MPKASTFQLEDDGRFAEGRQQNNRLEEVADVFLRATVETHDPSRNHSQPEEDLGS